jgi:uncharacterized protein (DUF433 family)
MEAVFKQHIEMRPSAIHGEKACIAGSRIRVEDVYVWHVVQGRSVAEIVADFPQLTPADVHAALAYYWDNEELIQQQMKRGREVAAEAAKQNPSKLQEAIRRRSADGDSVPS